MAAVADMTQMWTKHGDPIKLIKIDDDILHPVVFPSIEDKLGSIRDLEQKDGDILLCRYPKCGGHWLMAIISKLISKNYLKVEGKDIDIIPHGLEFEPVNNYASANEPRFLTSHLWSKRIPKYFIEGKAKVVLLLRNPKDVAVSFYHHLQNAIDINNKQSWEEFFDSYISGEIMFGGYHNYLKSWEQELSKNRSIDIVVCYYEDFKQDAFKQTKMLTSNLGLILSDEELYAILEESSFGRLKEKDNSKQNTLPKFEADRFGTSVIYRKGEVGDWKNHFTAFQSEQYDRMLNTTLGGNVLTFRYQK